MRLNAAELEQAVFLTLKKQMEAAAPLAPDGTLRVEASVTERAEYEQQIESAARRQAHSLNAISWARST